MIKSLFSDLRFTFSLFERSGVLKFAIRPLNNECCATESMITASSSYRDRLAFAPGKLAQQNAQILDHDLETARIDPSPHLLIDRCPRRQIVGQKAPVAARLGNVAKCVEHIAQRVVSLRSVLATQRQIRDYKRPLLVRYIARIARPESFFHTSIVSQLAPFPYPKANKGIKLITGPGQTTTCSIRWRQANTLLAERELCTRPSRVRVYYLCARVFYSNEFSLAFDGSE